MIGPPANNIRMTFQWRAGSGPKPCAAWIQMGPDCVGVQSDLRICFKHPDKFVCHRSQDDQTTKL